MVIAALSPAQPATADLLDTLGNITQRLFSDDRQQPTMISRTRHIPNDSQLGYLSAPVRSNRLRIDDDDYVLAFGARIRDEHNRIVQTSMISGRKRIRYTVNAEGRVYRVWLLAAGEK